MKVLLVSALLLAQSMAFQQTSRAVPKSSSSLITTKRHSVRYEGDLDTEALLSASTFPIPPDQLIEKAKEFILVQRVGLNDTSVLADDFVFRAAFVETDRDEFVKALEGFNLEDSFDMKQQFFGWTVDPLQPNRVYVINRQEGTHVKDFVGVKPTNKTLVLPPQNLHVDFTEDGKVKEFGFYVIDRAQGNTGGLGGAFAFFYGVGRPLPFPEGKPYKYSFQRKILTALFNFFGRFRKKKQE